MELINIQPTGKTPINKAIPVYIITKEGKNYNDEGMQFIKDGLKNHFGINEDLAIYTGVGLNDASVLSTLLRKKSNAYIVLATKEKVGFIPQDVNETICLNLDDNKNISSWEVLMRSCELEPY